MSNTFIFSEDLADKVRDALIDRIADAINNGGYDVRDFIEHGYPGVTDMDGNELMDEYMNWTGTFSLDENPDDLLLKRMFDEHNSFELEKAYLKDGESEG